MNIKQRASRVWHSLARRVGWPRGNAAELDLARAYRAVFLNGDASAQMVLADLANVSGFFRANGPGFGPDDRAHSDGMRTLYGRAHKFLAMGREELDALAEAARLEALADAQSEGQN